MSDLLSEPQFIPVDSLLYLLLCGNCRGGYSDLGVSVRTYVHTQKSGTLSQEIPMILTYSLTPVFLVWYSMRR
jgi:hypothetical protein